MRVSEAVALFADRRMSPDAVAEWGLDRLWDKSFGSLSGGQRQRLFIALALLNEPEIVFLDELTQGLDPSARRVVWELIKLIRARGTTVVLVTHFIDEAEVLCDRVVVMRDGRFVAHGTPAELVEQYGPGDRRVVHRRQRRRRRPPVDLRRALGRSLRRPGRAPRRPPDAGPRRRPSRRGEPGSRHLGAGGPPRRRTIPRGRRPRPDRKECSMSVTRRLLTSEFRLLLREPLVLAFVVAFPVITVLVLGGVFDDDDPAFEGTLPSDYYIAAYFGVVIAAVGLIMLPVHIAAYREAGVLRRLRRGGLSPLVVPGQPVRERCVVRRRSAPGSCSPTAALAYGLPAVEDVPRTVAGIVAGSLAFISIGVLLGTLLPNARAAQGVGLLLFLPMFLLAGGGPPPEAMGPVMNDISNALP